MSSGTIYLLIEHKVLAQQSPFALGQRPYLAVSFVTRVQPCSRNSFVTCNEFASSNKLINININSYGGQNRAIIPSYMKVRHKAVPCTCVVTLQLL